MNRECPICTSTAIRSLVEIRNVPVLANVLWDRREDALRAARGDLSLGFCSDCGHIYNHAFEADLLDYDPRYDNALHFSPRFRAFASSLAKDLVERHGLDKARAIDIGCGDGSFLDLLCRSGIGEGIGFDPSYAPRPEIRTDGKWRVIPEYYSELYADHQAELITCRHVLEHIPAPRSFLKMLRRSLGDRCRTVVYFEVPNALATLESGAIWDLIYEHCSYFTPPSLHRLFRDAGFHVTRIQPTYDSQYLSLEAHVSTGGTNGSSLLTGQDARNLVGLADRFPAQYHTKVRTWRTMIATLAEQELKVALWGAGSKGITISNILGLAEAVPYVVDVSPRKQGRFVGGTGQEIVAPAFLRDYRPDMVVLANGIYEAEIRTILRDLGVAADILVA